MKNERHTTIRKSMFFTSRPKRRQVKLKLVRKLLRSFLAVESSCGEVGAWFRRRSSRKDVGRWKNLNLGQPVGELLCAVHLFVLANVVTSVILLGFADGPFKRTSGGGKTSNSS